MVHWVGSWSVLAHFSASERLVCAAETMARAFVLEGELMNYY